MLHSRQVYSVGMRGPITAHLIQIATEVARSEQAAANALRDQIRALGEQLEEASEKLRLATSAVPRLDHFDPEIDANFQCPMCWIKNEVHADLRPIASETGDDLFRCEVCGQTVEV